MKSNVIKLCNPTLRTLTKIEVPSIEIFAMSTSVIWANLVGKSLLSEGQIKSEGNEALNFVCFVCGRCFFHRPLSQHIRSNHLNMLGIMGNKRPVIFI